MLQCSVGPLQAAHSNWDTVFCRWDFMSKAELRARAAVSGIEDLEGFMKKQRARVLHFCMKILKKDNWADEVAQEVMIKFADHLAGPNPRSKSAYGPWLTTVARNACMDV